MDVKNLIYIARQGVMEASNYLVLDYQDRVYAQAFWMVGEMAIAEDLTQQTFLIALRKLGSFRGGSFKVWLLRIVTDLSLDELCGFWGRVVAFRLDISNRQANEWTISLLNLQPTDNVLEVGYGSGLTLQLTAGYVPQGFVAGVDSSHTMLKIAQKRNTRWITANRMELYLGSMESLDFPDDHFDKVYSVQVINYIPDRLKGLNELHRVTKPGGRVALFFEAKEKFAKVQGLIEGIYQPCNAKEVVALLEQAGFTHAWFESKDFVARKVHYTGLVALGEKE